MQASCAAFNFDVSMSIWSCMSFSCKRDVKACTLYNIECCCVGHEMRARIGFSYVVHEQP